MIKGMVLLVSIIGALPMLVFAQEETVQVGKYANPVTSSTSMILALLMVLVVIIICAAVLKRFNLTPSQTGKLKVITSLSLGTKERLVVVQVAEKQLLLGVTAQQITVIETLDEPINADISAANLPQSMNGILAKFANKK